MKIKRNNSINTLKSAFVLLGFLLLSASSLRAQEYLQSNEVLIFQFKTLEDRRLVVAMEEDEEYLVCRFGTTDSFELQFPFEDTTSWLEFQYELVQIDRSVQHILTFRSQPFIYILTEERSEVGVIRAEFEIIHSETDQVIIHEGDLYSVRGTLERLQNTSRVEEQN